MGRGPYAVNGSPEGDFRGCSLGMQVDSGLSSGQGTGNDILDQGMTKEISAQNWPHNLGPPPMGVPQGEPPFPSGDP